MNLLIAETKGSAGGGGGGKGDTGVEGPQGDTGVEGDTGVGDQGDTGIDGDPGDTGVAGGAGSQGDAGEKGDTGEGDTGVDGPQGDTGEGDTGVDGEKGDTGEGDTGVAGEKGDTGEGDTGVAGPAGDTGADSTVAGDTGVEGAKGDTGEGDTGIDGDQGDTGEKGDTGTAGGAGSKGDTGIGEKGDTGDAGGAGSKGDTGEGDTGVTGSQGDTGEDSTVPGPKGDTGSGTQGDTGVAGDTGIDGAKGDTGDAGDTGADSTVPGDTGVTGDQGDTGEGTQGDTGEGDTGVQGASGYAFEYQFSTDTTAPPASGYIEFDNGVIASVTEIYVHDTDRNSADLDAQLNDFRIGDRVKIFAEGDTDFATFEITSTSDDGAYHTFVVTYIASSGGFANDENVNLAPSHIGDQGDTGIQGDQGDTGIQGVEGDTGADSTVPGDTGVTGDRGDTGDQGDTGSAGSQGDTGADSTVQGDTGIDGAKGDTGEGDTGVAGGDGAAGDTGEKGDTGAGVQGDTGDAGSQGDTGDAGDTGTEYPWQGVWATSTVYALNDCVENNGNGYVCISAHTSGDTDDEPGVGATWETYWDLLVEKGDQGDTGVGSQGDTGADGGQGDTGDQGDTGADSTIQGDTGIDGFKGDTGEKGDTGSGDKGDTGDAGVQGDTGDQGNVGDKGDTGESLVGGLRILYKFEVDDFAAPPTSGYIEANNATLSSVTNFFASETDRDSNDVTSVLDVIEEGDTLALINNDSSTYHLYTVVANNDSGAYRTIIVSYLGGYGTLGDEDEVTLSALKQGPVGDPGYGWIYNFDTAIVAPPIFGAIRFNNATWSNVTTVWAYDQDRLGNPLQDQLDDISIGDRLKVTSQVDDDFVTFVVTSVSDDGAYHTFGVTFIGEATSGDFSDTENIILTPSFQGDIGVGAVNQISITVENPTASEDINLGFFFVNITITEIQAVVVGTTPSVTIDPEHRAARDTASNDILSAPVAITNEGAGQNLTSFDDPTVPADSWVVLLTTAKTGTVTELTVTIRYTID